MASRLMLSLKKVSTEPMELWSLSTMGDFRRGRLPTRGTIRFAPHEVSGTLPPPNEEDIEFDSVSQLPPDRGSQ